MNTILSFTKRFRIMLSRVLMGCVVLLMIFSVPLWQPGIAAGLVMDLLSFILVIAAAFGRLWALSYISGHKSEDLVTEGPYSIMRNPLYFFSLCGVLGICMLYRSLLVSGSVLLAFAVYYPLVVRAEEVNLSKFFGDNFARYCSTVPAFIPNISLYHEPKEYPVNARLFRRSFLSVVWFPLAYILIQMLQRLHEAGVLPAFLSIP